MSLRDLFSELSRPASPILSLKDGQQVTIQFVQDFEQTRHCKTHQRVPSDDGFKNYRCVSKRAGCPICDAKKPSTRIFFLVKHLDDEGKTKIFPLSPGRSGVNIQTLNMYYDANGTITDTAWLCKRTGEGLSTTYTFMAAPKVKIDKNLPAADDLPDIDSFIERTLPDSTSYGGSGNLGADDGGGFPNLV